jgi:hypothetical protein
MIKKVLAATVALAVLLTAVSVASASHSWNGYHWPSDNLSPTVVDKTPGQDFQVPTAVQEWANLGTPIQPSSGNTGEVEVVVKRMNANWLGVARIWVDEQDHIQKGRVELNRLYLNSLTANEWDHVLCQELGHIWGLNHNFDGPTDGTPDDTCMNSSIHLGEFTSPNGHDTEQLKIIYDGHTDDTGSTDEGSGGPDCNKNTNAKQCRSGNGAWITVDIFPLP